MICHSKKCHRPRTLSCHKEYELCQTCVHISHGLVTIDQTVECVMFYTYATSNPWHLISQARQFTAAVTAARGPFSNKRLQAMPLEPAALHVSKIMPTLHQAFSTLVLPCLTNSVATSALFLCNRAAAQLDTDGKRKQSQMDGSMGSLCDTPSSNSKRQRMTSEQMTVLLDSLQKNVATCPERYTQLVIKEMKDKYPELELNMGQVGWGEGWS